MEIVRCKKRFLLNLKQCITKLHKLFSIVVQFYFITDYTVFLIKHGLGEHETYCKDINLLNRSVDILKKSDMVKDGYSVLYMFLGASSLKKDQPLFTLKQVGYFCERLIKDHEEKMREEYEQILNTKLAGKTLQIPHSCVLASSSCLSP